MSFQTDRQHRHLRRRYDYAIKMTPAFAGTAIQLCLIAANLFDQELCLVLSSAIWERTRPSRIPLRFDDLTVEHDLTELDDIDRET